MKKISLSHRRLLAVVALVVLLIAAAVPAVSAYDYEEHYDIDYHGWANQITVPASASSRSTTYNYDTIQVRDVKSLQDVSMLKVQFDINKCAIPDKSQSFPIVMKIGSNIIGYGTYGTFATTNRHVVWVTIDNIDVSGYSGGQIITFQKIQSDEQIFARSSPGAEGDVPWGTFYKSGSYRYNWDTSVQWSERGHEWNFYRDVDATFELYAKCKPEVYYHKVWASDFTLNKFIGAEYEFSINRDYGAVLVIYDGDNNLIVKDTNIKYTPELMYLTNPPFTVAVSPDFETWFNQTYYQGIEQPDDSGAIQIFIKNSQTGALLANAHIVINASVNGELHEIVNESLPSGTYTGDLQPTGGGMPNPDFYRLITTAEGYNSIMPYIDFEVDGGATIYAYLDPIGGAPEDENNTFIDFFVRDMSANPISGATVNFGGYTLITNSAGYTIFEVDKSKTYSWTVSKSGYGSLTGNAVIGSNARHTINTVLAPAVTPTTPTSIPTSTPISPTPTMTAPSGEPVSNWLEWFAAHFGMILGGGAEIGKIFMWLCFSVPVGVYVGKEAKAGAAGFMAGAGVVTLFFVLIGWVPIWLLVLLALIIGLLYAKVFNNYDTGGGR